nr:sulfite exporter TauE/SafE family protein [Sphingomicrobium nitratireducens]
MADPGLLFAFVAIGFAAQLVDGALGMAYGTISTTALVSLGVPPAAASAGVHGVETFTTGISAISHIAHRNVLWPLFFRIAIPGMLGGIAGAYLLTGLDASVARPIVLAYLMGIGLLLLWRGWRHVHVERPPRVVEPLGLVGGFLDAAGGGGWGPIVSSNLMVQGGAPRTVIGTVNSAEFLVTLTTSITFLLTLGLEGFTVAMVGLLVGGVFAAPFGALVAKRVKADRVLVMVGTVLVLTSAAGLWSWIG